MSWHFNFDEPSTVELGGKDSANADGGYLTLKSSDVGRGQRYWTMPVQKVNYGDNLLDSTEVTAFYEVASPMTYIPRKGWENFSTYMKAAGFMCLP